MNAPHLQHHAAPWRSSAYPTTVACHALLYPDEIAYLHWAGQRAAEMGANIVDLGAFLGGSSLALAQGSRSATNPPRIHAYDPFRVTETQVTKQTVPGGVGDSYLDQYRANLHEHLHRITTHEGYIPLWADDEAVRASIYPESEPIGVLFIDCAKRWGVHPAILRAFTPHLVEGSLVIQQDFKGVLVYLALHMYQLRASLEPVHTPDGGSVGFITNTPVEQSTLDGLWTPADVDRLGRDALIRAAADWFDAHAPEPLSHWIWLAGAAEMDWAVDSAFIERCIQNAKVGLDGWLAGTDDPIRAHAHRENWNSEVGRLSAILRDASLDGLAQSASEELGRPVAGISGSQSQPQADGFRSIWDRIEQRCHAKGYERIALYCSGRHTSRLLAGGWPTSPGLRVVAILDDAPGKAGFRIGGVPVVSPEMAGEYTPDVIIPSTDAHEEGVWASCVHAAERAGAARMRVYTAEQCAL